MKKKLPCLILVAAGVVPISSHAYLSAPSTDEDGKYTVSWNDVAATSCNGTTITMKYFLRESGPRGNYVWHFTNANARSLAFDVNQSGSYEYHLEVARCNYSNGAYRVFYSKTPRITVNVLGISSPTNMKFKYDELGRLTDVEDNLNGDRHYEYDEAGNRKKVTVE